MSYSSPHSEGPGGNGYGYDDYGMPAYHEQSSSRHQKPARPRPSQQQQQQQYYEQQHQQYYEQQQHHQSDPRMRFPRPQAYPRAQPMQSSPNMYDGSGYGEPEQDQWPLSSQPAPAPRHQPPPQTHRQQPAGGRSGPPPRPQRPDYVPPNLEPQRQPARSASADHYYQQQPPQQRQQPRSASADHPSNYQQPVSSQSHHGNGQWTGDGYSYNAPQSSSHGHPIVQHANYNKNIPPRPPLGPPPSSRRGPSSYYSKQIADVHPIVEEAERASLTREISREGDGGWGSQSRVSMTSSNAIPIGIPKFYLDGRESGVSITPSSAYSEYDPDNSPPRREEPLRAFKQRMQQLDADDGHDTMSSQQQKAAERKQARGMNDYFPPVDSHTSSTSRDESPSEANIPVRQASLGKRSKPTLTTVKSGDRMRSRNSGSNDTVAGLPSQQRRAAEKQETVEDRRTQPEGDARPGADRSAQLSTHVNESSVAPPQLAHIAGVKSSNASFLDSSSDSTNSARPSAPLDSPKSSIRVVQSKENLTTPKPTHTTRGRSPLAQTDADDYDARAKEMMLSDPEKDGHSDILRQDSDTLKSPTAGFSGQRVGRRVPARIDVDAIRDEEKRGSLSSLSDLIKRATKLASNLDRGRTASRLGMEGWLGPANSNSNSNGKTNSSGELAKYRRSAGSISDMLNSFPPPAIATPTGHESRSLANWSSRRNSAPLPSDSDAASRTRSRKQRRCCGIPLWLFITLLLLLLGLVAAAAIIPVVLIVLPNQTDNSSASSSSQSHTTGTQAATLSKCEAKLTCENGGQAFPTSASNQDTCRCLCVNSFTGPTCSTQSTVGCSSIAVTGMQENATIGNAIPRLLSLAEPNYALQLDTQTLLGLFNEADLDCASENALVSFDGKAQKHRRVAAPQASQTETQSTHPAEATSNGIVFDSSPSPSQTSASSASSSSSPTTASSPSASSTANVDVDFARAAVLYILQSSSSLQDAESAQKALQENLDGNAGGVVAIGVWKVDLDGKKVTKA